MRSVILKTTPANAGHATPVWDTAVAGEADLPLGDSGPADAILYRIDEVPAEVPLVEVVRRLNRTALWRVFRLPYRLLDDGAGTHWRILTPEAIADELAAAR